MKKRLIGTAIAAVCLGFLFAACDDTQIIAYERSASVERVDVTFNSQLSEGGDSISSTDIVVSWTEAKNAVTYTVYVQRDYDTEGQKGVTSLGSTINTSYNWTNSNNWTGQVRFGVVARDFDSNHATSNITWSEYINIAGNAPGGNTD